MSLLKKTLPLLLLIYFSQLAAQKIHFQEDFNSATLPSNWSNNLVSGNQAWSFGSDASANVPGINNLDSTSLAYFDDDALGANANNNTAELLSPIFDNSTDSNTYLEFDYNFREFGGAFPPDSFWVDVYDGNQWQRVFSRGYDDCGNFSGSLCLTNGFPHAMLDISAFRNSNCQVRFTYYDGNDWGWYAAIDNIKAWSRYDYDLSLYNIPQPESLCDLSDTLKILVVNEGNLAVANYDICS